MPVFLFVALAGAAGAGARYGLDLIFSRDAHHVPWVTFAINVSGSFLLGAAVAVLDAHPSTRDAAPGAHDRPTGSVHDVRDAVARDLPSVRPGHLVLASAYSFGSLAAGLAAVTLGAVAGRLV
jgi:CrcB protein